VNLIFFRFGVTCFDYPFFRFSLPVILTIVSFKPFGFFFSFRFIIETTFFLVMT